MLSERLIGLRDHLLKAYRKDMRAADVREAAQQLTDIVTARLGSTLEVRGIHVHRDRFADRDIRQLGMMRIVAERKPELRQQFEFLYRYTRQKKATWVRQQNVMIAELLDDVFAIITLIVLSPSGALLPPVPTRRDSAE